MYSDAGMCCCNALASARRIKTTGVNLLTKKAVRGLFAVTIFKMLKGGMNMSKHGSLKFQMINRLCQLAQFGESKHLAKQRMRAELVNDKSNRVFNPGAAMEGICSYQTFQSYKQSSMEFIEWIRKTYPTISLITDIQKEHAIRYINERLEEGKSAWTLHLNRFALNKTLGLNITSKDIPLVPKRLKKDIIRSRHSVKHDAEWNPENYADIIDFAKACGLRRSGMLKVTPRDIYQKNGRWVCHIIEKGQKEREATIRPCLLERVQTIINGREIDKPIFPHIPKRIDIHSYRREYAQAQYETTFKALFYEKKLEYPTSEDAFYKVKNGEIFVKLVLRLVSADLGHSRLDVLVTNYLT